LSDSGPETPKPDQTVGQSELDKDLDNLRVQNEALRADNERLQKELAKAAEDYQTQVIISQQFNKQAEDVRSQLAAAQATIGTIEKELEVGNKQLAERDAELVAVAADREELAQIKKEAKEAAAEIHREGRSIELEKVRWQRELSDARAELADAKSTILKQGNKIRELERGYSLKPNPKESALRLEIGELRSQLSDLQQNSVAASDLSAKAGKILNFMKPFLLPKKTHAHLLLKIEEILEGDSDEA
jgi:chromosome segregation ATPase